MTFSYAPEPDTSGPRERKTFNGVGLAALIVGVLSLIGSVIPILNYVSGFLAAIGIVLGIIGLVLKDRPKGMALGGLVVSAIALILSVVLAILYTAGIVTAITGAVQESEARSSAEAADEVRVTYQLEAADGTTTASVVWSTSTGGALGAESAKGVSLPFTREVVVPDSSEFDAAAFSISGVAGIDDALGTSGELTCRILVDGAVVTEQTATGVGATVSCVASADDLRDAAE